MATADVEMWSRILSWDRKWLYIITHYVVKGKGQPGAAGPGDLMVTVKVKPHDFFVRDGDNIRVHVPVTFAEAALGADISVPTLAGDTVRVRVPAGTPSGRTLRGGRRRP